MRRIPDGFRVQKLPLQLRLRPGAAGQVGVSQMGFDAKDHMLGRAAQPPRRGTENRCGVNSFRTALFAGPVGKEHHQGGDEVHRQGCHCTQAAEGQKMQGEIVDFVDQLQFRTPHS